MSQIVSDSMIAALDASGAFSEQRNADLWQQIPDQLRLNEFTARTLPDHSAFHWRLDGRPPWRGFNTIALPDTLQRELAYAIWRIVEQGLLIDLRYRHLVGWLVILNDERRATGRLQLRSLMDMSLASWQREFAKARARRTGQLGWIKTGAVTPRGCYRHLAIAYDTGEWWRQDVWSPRYDPRIPLREHEPTRANAGYDFLAVQQPWLRDGVKWHLKIALETGQLRWSTARARLTSVSILSRYLAEREIDEPRLCTDATDLHLLALDFLAHVKARRACSGAHRGEPITAASVTNYLIDVERFYAFMTDHRLEAARALSDERWARLGDEHARLWRAGEKPRAPERPDDDVYFDDTTMAQLMQHAGVIGAASEDGGLGDEQSMRLLMLLARTGRRISELRLLDFDCLLAIQGLAAATGDSDALIAKLRYRQTKIDGAPDTIFVDTEITQIVAAQQTWAHARVRALLRDPEAPPPRYLFIATSRNNQGRHPISRSAVAQRLHQLGERMDIRDSQGHRPALTHLHRFRHTRATNLINAGVPVHVVQRYLGHVSPRMTMHYAKTLRETHEREFLRYRKITADARELDIDQRDLFALLELDKRTDRVLPNGLCMLPPRQVCNRGNACLTCDKFATDASYTPEHERQLAKLRDLIAERQQGFAAKTGAPMSPSNVWLQQRLSEQRALEQIITVLHDPQLAADAQQGVRGAGTSARPANQPRNNDNGSDAR
ncbi:MAG: tyrosine-type recombinase/integrase [Actinomycetota bacterium]|nr:tyrosine-type recombinase/integrase [Actinomycetota bacterium]